MHCSTWNFVKSLTFRYLRITNTFLSTSNKNPSFGRNSNTTSTLKMSSIDKYITFIRHGMTEMNEAMEIHDWGSDNFVDKLLFDTKLSSRGIQQCEEFNQILVNDQNHPHTQTILSSNLILVSPLRRTLQTADYSLGSVLHNGSYKHVKKLVLPLAAERLYLSADVGSSRDILQSEFPHWDYTHVAENDAWWYRHDETSMGPYEEWRPRNGIYAVPGEPEAVFRERMRRLRDWLLSREEENIVLVSHWGVIRALTGHKFHNLEVKRFHYSDILDEPFIDKE